MQVRSRHVVLAVLLHVIVLGMLLIGFRCTRKIEPPPVMQATIVDAKPQKPAPPPKEEPKVDEEQKRLEEEKKARELEEQKKKETVEEEQRKVEEQQRVEQARRKAAEDARRKKEEDARKQKEEQARREAEKKKEEEKRREEELLQSLSSEETQRQSAAKASAQQIWAAAIADKVRRNWLRPPNASDEFRCRVEVTLLPTGDVTNVKLVDSCGSPVLDDSVQRAVYKSSPLPRPDDPSVFDRDLQFTFVPHL
jgi:colicin import membrane protein